MWLNMVMVKDNARTIESIRFSPRDSLIHTPEQPLKLPLNRELPAIVIDALSDVGVRTVASGYVRLSSTSSNCAVSPNYAEVTSGFATFMNVRITTVTTSTTPCSSLRIRAVANDKNSTLTVDSGKVTVYSTELAHSVLWISTPVSYPNTPPLGIAVVNEPMESFRVQVLTTFLELDAGTTGVMMKAVASKGTLSGSEVMVENGVAVFNDLIFTDNPKRAHITFTLRTSAIQEINVTTGDVVVREAALHASYLEFDPSSWVTATTPKNWTKLAVLPPIVIRMLDDMLQFDPAANDIVIRAHVADGSNLDGTEVVMHDGIAVFSALRIKDIGVSQAELVFNAENANIPAVTQKRRLTSAPIKLFPSASPTAADWKTSRLEFGSAEQSLVTYEGQPLFATVGERIPEIVVHVVSDIGVVHQPSSLQMVAFTGESVHESDIEMFAVSGVGGYYRFACMRYITQPHSLSRITFEISDPSLGVHLRIRTGAVTVLESVVPNYSLRFRHSEFSAVSHEGQTLSAVIGLAIPSIQIEFTDSAHNIDTTNSNVIVEARTSSGKLSPDGKAMRAMRGIVTFSQLRYTHLGRDPTLTFLVLSSTNISAAGKSVATGSIMLSQRVLPNAHLAFVVESSNTFKYPGEPLVMTSLVTQMRVQLQLLDSSYHVDTSNTDTSLAVAITTASNNISVTPTRATVSAGKFAFNSLHFVSSSLPTYEIYLTFTAESSLGHSKVAGQKLFVGPISIQPITTTKVCSLRYEEPTVSAYYTLSSAQVAARRTTLINDIATLLAIEPTRVRFGNISAHRGVNVISGGLWDGAKALVSFQQPTPTSANPKSSSDLARDFVMSTRHSIPAQYNLHHASYHRDEVQCDEAAFLAGKKQAETSTCTLLSGVTLCSCYEDMELFRTWAKPCQEHVQSHPTESTALTLALRELCTTLKGCTAATITNVCGEVELIPKSIFLYWFIPLVVGIFLIIVFVLVRYLVYRRRQRYPNMSHPQGRYRRETKAQTLMRHAGCSIQ
eukprot:PhM_4_TR9196/c0_g1_i1/m.16025